MGCNDTNKVPTVLTFDTLITNNLIKEVINEINNNYADEITREKLEVGAINGLLSALDEYSLYISQDEFEALNRTTRGSFFGIGVEIKQIKEGIEIQSIIDNSPAFNAGLKIGDIIVSIDNTDIKQLSPRAIINRLNIDTRSQLKLSVFRNKTDKLDFMLKRTVVLLDSVLSRLIDDILLLKITYFNEYTVSQVKRKIKTVLKQNIKGIIIDLRNNPGGIINQAIKFSDLFLVDKNIAVFKSKRIMSSRIMKSNSEDIINGLPIIVLINRQTASGAELVAAALSDNKRAILIGETTYGKGVLQSIIPIPGRGAIKLTTSYFYSPNGSQINHNGVKPSIEIKQSNNDKEDLLILRAIDLLKGIHALNK